MSQCWNRNYFFFSVLMRIQIICMHFQLQHNMDKDAMLVQAYIVNQPLHNAQ